MSSDQSESRLNAAAEKETPQFDAASEKDIADKPVSEDAHTPSTEKIDGGTAGSFQPVIVVSDSAAPENIGFPGNEVCFEGKTVISKSAPYGINYNDSVPSTDQISITKEPVYAENLQIGAVIGHFKITRYIGGGGMGRVYEAQDTALGRRVAVKVLPRQRAQDQATVARFFNEARSAARLNHEHIAQVYFCGEENGIPYIAFEYVDGINLRKYTENRGGLDLKTAIVFLLQISDALAHAANNGIIHRDVKPSNIIITNQQKAKLIDMGLARFNQSNNPEDDLTVSGVTLGTFDYISPEQARDPRQADVRSDIYSLGCTFFFMMAAQPPFEGTALQKLLQHQGEKPPDIRKFAPDMPSSAAAVMEKMMAKDPADRYQRPEDLVADLKAVADQIGLKEEEQKGDVFSQPRKVKRRLLVYHLPWICALTLLGIWVGYWYLNEISKSNAMPTAEQRLNRHKGSFSAPIPDSEQISPEENLPKSRMVPVRLGARRRMLGIESVSDRSMNTVVALAPQVREYGGIGIPLFSSNDLPNSVKSAVLTPETAKMLELTVDSESDLYSGGWSPIHEEQNSRDDIAADIGNTFREGVDPVIDLKGKKDGCYASLEEFAASLTEWNKELPPEARHEIVVRLAFNDTLPVSSILLTDAAVKIVPAPGYTPKMVFNSRESSDLGAASLFTLQNAALSISNVPIYFDLSDQEIISDEWTLVRFDSRSYLALEGTEMAIKNGDTQEFHHPNVAFFRMIGSAGGRNAGTPRIDPALMVQGTGESGFLQSSVSRKDGAQLKFSQVFIHGDAALIDFQILSHLQTDAADSLFLTDGPALQYKDRSRLFAGSGGKINLHFDSVFYWCRSPLFLIDREMPAGGNLGKEINASLEHSLFLLSGNPIGEIRTESFEEITAPVPNWKLSENLLASAGGLVSYTEARQNSEKETGVKDSESDFGNNNIVFDISASENLFWAVSRDNIKQIISQTAKQNLESEFARQWFNRLESRLFGSQN